MVATRREQGGLVDDQREIGTGRSRSRGRNLVEVHVVRERDRPRVDLEDLPAPQAVRRLDGDPAIEAARPEQCGVEDLGAVGGPEHDHVRLGIEAVHLGQDLVERLLALVMAAAEAADAARARPSDRVELVDEDDRGRRLLGLLEEVAHARCADADDRFDELRGRQGEERRVRLPRHRPCEERLSRPRRAVQQDAARDAGAQPRVALRVLEEVDDFDQLLLGLVDAGHVVERDPHLPAAALLDATGGRPAERPEDAPTTPAQLTAGEPHQAANEQQRRREAEEEAEPERSALVRRLCVDHDVLLAEQLGQRGGVDERRHLRLELVDLPRLGVSYRVVGRLALQVAVDRVLARGDLLHVAGLHLLEEERLVRHLRALLGPSRHERDQEVEGQEPDEDSKEPPAARKHRRLGLLLRTPAAARRLDVPAGRLASVANRAF
jgi:hypothetical protein